MNETLTNRQIALVLFGTVVGYGVMGLPKVMAEEVGTASWIPLIIATCIAIITTYILTYLGYVHKTKTIYEYSTFLAGKVLTFIFMIIYIVYFFMFATMEVRLTSEVIKQTILVQTPVWALSLMLLLVTYFSLSKGLRVIARICELYGIIVILFYLFIYTLLFTKGKIINLRPFLGSGNIIEYIKSSLKTLIPFLGVEILALIPFDKTINSKRIFKYTTIMVVIIGFLYIYIVESCISVTGVDSIVYYRDAVLATIRRSDFPWLQFFRRLDGIVIVAWILSIYCTVVLILYGASSLLSKLINKTHYKLISFILVVASFIISNIPKNYETAVKLLDFTGYLGILTSILIPSILLVITKVKKKQGRQT